MHGSILGKDDKVGSGKKGEKRSENIGETGAGAGFSDEINGFE
jgi:hypothetical protein